jgi:hypothetical protein
LASFGGVVSAGDVRDVLAEEECFDTIYLDPMFPNAPRRIAAEGSTTAGAAGGCSDATWEICRAFGVLARGRVVVAKRRRPIQRRRHRIGRFWVAVCGSTSIAVWRCRNTERSAFSAAARVARRVEIDRQNDARCAGHVR